MTWNVRFFSRRLEAEVLALPVGFVARVFYCTIVDRQIVMLHQFVKKTEKTPAKELEIARRRMKELTNG